MKTIRVVLEKRLLEAADRAVRKLKTNRSALIREALRAHLRQPDQLSAEKVDREGHARYPQALDRLEEWDNVASPLLVARARKRSGMSEAGAVKLAIGETKAHRRR